MDKTRYHHSCAVITTSSPSGNIVLVCGGIGRWNCEIYDPATNSWTNGPTLLSTLYGHAIVTPSHSSMYDAFILGGRDSDGYSNKIYGVKDLTTVTLVGTLQNIRGDHVVLKIHVVDNQC